MKKIITLLAIISTTCIFAQIPTYVPSNGLVGYWPFNGNAADMSGNGNNGTVNGATLSTDRFGSLNNSYSFISNSILISNLFFDNGWQDYSVSLWFLTYDKTTTSQNLFNTNPHDGEGFSYNHPNAPNKISHWKNSNINIHAWDVFSANPLLFNPIDNQKWYYLTIVKQGNNYSYYVNGQLNKTSISVISALNQMVGISFGYSMSGSEYLNGKLDDIGIWNRALTQEEITELYYSENTCQSLVINTGVLSFNPPTYNNTATIYPNPANEHITIDCGNLANVSGWTIKISNTLGQEVFSGAMNTQQYVVPLNTWTGQGIYFVKIYDASNNLMNTKKIILQ
jgi:Concanavalin A-like lectin/glucanases superfamily/Secretion system C-terminal sorting domain